MPSKVFWRYIAGTLPKCLVAAKAISPESLSDACTLLYLPSANSQPNGFQSSTEDRLMGGRTGMGDIDCARIPIKAPREKHPQLNRKKVHPLNIQVVSNANLRTEVSLQSFYEVCMCMIPTFGIAIFCVDISINNSLGTLICSVNCSAVIVQTLEVLKLRFRCYHKSCGALQYTPEKCAKYCILACCCISSVKKGLPIDNMLENDNSPEEQLLNFIQYIQNASS
ncbi:putative nuclease HARBI1 [Penaeus vannamei]|uniref:putative nuclease HARBI1 n=1 Tax=Penaeus vannamei TaxID=6689 RepID=UPI00387F6258